MPVTIIPGSHKPKRHATIQPAQSLDDLLQRSCPYSYVRDETRVVASSFGIRGPCSIDVYPSSSSFVRSAIEAWGRHSHLVIRPEDVWFTILVQMNFFMEENAEALQAIFVPHYGTKTLLVSGDDWHDVMDKFRNKVQDNIRASWMSDWISPGFSTSTVDDERTATVLMMGLMKAFFKYAGEITCGIPSITLLGTKRDWRRLLKKIDRLDDFGTEPKDYASRLRRILTRIINSFDNPGTTETKDFWNQIVQAKVRHSRACGEPPTQYIISGWILGFFYWDSSGRVDGRFSGGWAKWRDPGSLEYDNVHYGEAALDDLPVGYAKAKFEMRNADGGPTGGSFHGWVLAGSIGKSIVDGAPKGYKAAIRSQRRVERSEAAHHEKTESGCLSGWLQVLNCFGGKHRFKNNITRSATGEDSNEKQAAKNFVRKSYPNNTHSTIQPMSGWFLFGPEKEVGPFVDEEETYGPTVDAVDSCDSVKHYREWEV